MINPEVHSDVVAISCHLLMLLSPSSLRGGGPTRTLSNIRGGSGVARGGFGGFNPIEKCQQISEDKIVENTQS